MKLLALVAALALLPQQDKITLKFNPKAGDKLVKTELTTMNLKAKVTQGGEDKDLEMEQKSSEVTATEYAQVAEGKVTKMVLDHREDVEEQKGTMTGGEWVKSEKPLHGKKITVSLKEGKLVREGHDGLDDKVVEKLTLEDRTSHLFPKQAVGPGDTWEIKGEDVRKFLADDDVKDATIKLKLLEIKEIDGRRCAVINAAFDVNGKTDNDLDLTMKLDAEVVVWIDRGYALSVKGKGTLTLKGGDADTKIAGEGPMTLEITTKVE
jgi:hypothetical protein